MNTPALPRPPVGEPAPEVALLDADGQLWRSTEHQGAPIVLIFHRHIH